MIKPVYSFCFFICLSICIEVSAQKDSLVIYFDSSMSVVKEEDNALFKEIAVKKDGLWHASLIHINLGIVTMKGSFTDSNLDNGEGLFEYYYPDGSVQNTGYYKNGKQEGTWQMFNVKRQLIDSAFYINGKPKAEAIYNYYHDGKLQRYEFSSLITKQKITREYDTAGHIKFYSEFLNKDGQATYYYPDGTVSNHSVFENNVRVIMDHFDETGKKISDKEYEQLVKKLTQKLDMPEYPGGDFAFLSYVENNLKSNASIRDQINNLGSITITFFLDENGKPINVQVVDDSSADISNVLIEIIKQMPKWKMNGLKNFGPVRKNIRFL